MIPRRDDAALIATLNDLLQLEHDALPAYALAIAGLRDPAHRSELETFREDHLRHVEELTTLIRDRGGLPLTLPHFPTGLLKLALQATGLSGGDHGILLAFRANEWQSRAKYGRAAEAADNPRVAAILRQAAKDEARHYAWSVAALEDLGLGNDTAFGTANAAFARVHGLAAELIEAAGRTCLEALVRASRA